MQAPLKPKTTVISRCEPVADVGMIAAPTFGSVQYRINAGDAVTFPWLSRIAINYEFYKFKALRFIYRTTSGEATSAAGSTAMGKAILVTNYDVSAPAFVTKTQAEQYEGVSSGPPYQKEIVHTVDCSNKRSGRLPISEFYVSAAAPLTDPHMYDMGRFQMVTQGGAAQAMIGELWVEYVCELIRPTVIGGQQTEGTWDLLTPNLSSNGVFQYTVGQDPVPRATGNFMAVDFGGAPQTRLTFPGPGTYEVILQLESTSNFTTTAITTIPANGNVIGIAQFEKTNAPGYTYISHTYGQGLAGGDQEPGYFYMAVVKVLSDQVDILKRSINISFTQAIAAVGTLIVRRIMDDTGLGAIYVGDPEELLESGPARSIFTPAATDHAAPGLTGYQSSAAETADASNITGTAALVSGATLSTVPLNTFIIRTSANLLTVLRTGKYYVTLRWYNSDTKITAVSTVTVGAGITVVGGLNTAMAMPGIVDVITTMSHEIEFTCNSLVGATLALNGLNGMTNAQFEMAVNYVY